MHKVIRKSFGGDIAVLARTPDQFSGILKRNPFGDVDGTKLYFSLLAIEPDYTLLQELLSADFSPDQARYANNTSGTVRTLPLKRFGLEWSET